MGKGRCKVVKSKILFVQKTIRVIAWQQDQKSIGIQPAFLLVWEVGKKEIWGEKLVYPGQFTARDGPQGACLVAAGGTFRWLPTWSSLPTCPSHSGGKSKPVKSCPLHQGDPF